MAAEGQRAAGGHPGGGPPSLAAQLFVTTPIRVLLNTGYRMVYPFLPEFSRGLNVTPESLIEHFPDVTDGTAPPWRLESYRRILQTLGHID